MYITGVIEGPTWNESKHRSWMSDNRNFHGEMQNKNTSKVAGFAHFQQ